MSCRGELIHCAMIVDADRVIARPGAILLEDGSVVAAGSPESIGRPDGVALEDRPDEVILPALVNVHAHLDLTHLGPIDYEGDFPEWIDHLRRQRADSDDAVTRSVRLGIEMTMAGGTALIGDIAGAGSQVPIDILRESPLGGVSFLELFGIGAGQPRGMEMIRRAIDRIASDGDGVRLGLQPHAPYSCGPDVYRAAAETGLPLSTHLAETPDEIRFVQDGTGPLADMLRNFGVWDESIRDFGSHPIDVVNDIVNEKPLVAAHLNYIEDRHLQSLATWPITVAYCPRASAYFNHQGHRYRDMLEAGIPVALGTDSLLCLDTPQRISVLDEMRFLHRRDSTDARTLLRMGTIDGARALGFDPALVSFAAGITAGVIGVRIDPDASSDPLVQVMSNDEPPRWICKPKVKATA